METGRLIENLIGKFDPVSLDEMDAARLMRRRDTKFILPVSLIPEILDEIMEDYRVLEINGIRMQEYHSTYYDTPELKMYLMHHNQRLNRHKVRVRTYASNNKSFLEVKLKNNRRETVKKRIPFTEEKLDEHRSSVFLSKNAPYDPQEIHPTLRNSFHRITLVHKTLPERVTIDTGLHYETADNAISLSLENLAVIELKRDRDALHSGMVKLLNRHRIQPTGFSKYCMGTVLTNKQVKNNLFKNRIRELEKIDKNSLIA